MGLFDKLKDALFEEVEEEVEEKPVEPKKEVVVGDKGSFKDKLLSRQKKKEKKEKEVIAQKVVLEENKIDDRVDRHVLRDEDFEIEPDNKEKEDDMVLERPITNNGSFTVIEDSDLVGDDYVPEEPQIIDVIPKTEEVEETEYSYYEEKKEPVEEKVYETQTKSYDHLYGMNGDTIEINGYGNSYRSEKTTFKPSPIISPIYGILDKNYRKEDIVQKREIHLTSEFERKNMTVDDVRKKAYGTLSDDLIDDMDKGLEEVSNNVEKEEDNLLIDLSSDISKPQVKEVTVGDAEEYYDDLGLEYNVDYKDGAVEASKESVVTEEVSEKVPEVEEVIETITSKEEESPNDIHINKNDTEDDDNLFDLIDSMYQEKE